MATPRVREQRYYEGYFAATGRLATVTARALAGVYAGFMGVPCECTHEAPPHPAHALLRPLRPTVNIHYEHGRANGSAFDG
ncbi:hypothetical protein ACIBSV_44970 [Embleya sp. NPDC050154]|uniref:hypothetical protein n=1 Tax=Embleya sp. NPDC050154 TaxID=3363988 RepID=UPI00378CD633